MPVGIYPRAVDFFVYSRAASDPPSDDPALNEEHWAYMDRFARGMTARGPTLGPDRETWTGSLHILDLPSAAEAREFVENEPYNRAGLFAHHTMRRFENLLCRTMWEFSAAPDEPLFLVLAAREPEIVRERLVVHGALFNPDDETPAGFAFALQAPTREAVEAFFRGEEILDWEFGGRR